MNTDVHIGCWVLDVRCLVSRLPGFSRVRRSLLRGSQGGTGVSPVPFGAPAESVFQFNVQRLVSRLQPVLIQC